MTAQGKTSMNFSERLFLIFCSPHRARVDCNDLPEDEIKYDAHALSYYTDCFGEEFLNEIRNRIVLNFGFGGAMQVIAAVKAGTIGTTGIAIRESCAMVARRLARRGCVGKSVASDRKITRSAQ